MQGQLATTRENNQMTNDWWGCNKRRLTKKKTKQKSKLRQGKTLINPGPKKSKVVAGMKTFMRV